MSRAASPFTVLLLRSLPTSSARSGRPVLGLRVYHSLLRTMVALSVTLIPRSRSTTPLIRYR
ncbi:hypothetical protein EIP86_009236 [Pleurotus ostreatoroseus]|nr:hypothetical protein EIP86_009236 [Pleurotus ostreatoroseus]